ncbi:sigma-70 family RNA polymerase sigma factor [Saccharopolyspora sp. TS4A08]|uniref:Sigma-70 family RNA polymerase sigma factor n=1 Tax=Saccharopolyspora ipomoeae TaxID=3042027 RepID=A0ABT6PT78_9PSEU|nr:sigma-70 family RNA polymerase sigma factor [Saccharopolyspora sp. TS4A08]MDI2031197.1 sigma-70 family RNA polymerase sigma factor [Saccharopolyspora sp. TS4A08]
MSSPETLAPPAPDTAGRTHHVRSRPVSSPSTPDAWSEIADTVLDNCVPDSWAYVSAAQQGDNDAFGRLYDEYSQTVYRYVLFRVSDHCLAEDITSETFLRALRRIASISYQGRDVAAWFITIAKNLILDHIKSSRNRLEIPTSEVTDHLPAKGSHVGPEHQVLLDATNSELLQCIRQLNPDQRECIRLRFLQDLSVTETAVAMQRNEGAVKALQHRAVRRLAQLLPDDLR